MPFGDFDRAQSVLIEGINQLLVQDFSQSILNESGCLVFAEVINIARKTIGWIIL
jgi:hypothetical protein